MQCEVRLLYACSVLLGESILEFEGLLQLYVWQLELFSALHSPVSLFLQTSIGQGSEDRQYQEVGKKPIGIVTIEVCLPL